MRQGAGIKLQSPRRTGAQEGASSIFEFVAEVAHEAEGVGSEDFGGGGADGGVDFYVDGGGAGFHFGWADKGVERMLLYIIYTV